MIRGKAVKQATSFLKKSLQDIKSTLEKAGAQQTRAGRNERR